MGVWLGRGGAVSWGRDVSGGASNAPAESYAKDRQRQDTGAAGTRTPGPSLDPLQTLLCPPATLHHPEVTPAPQRHQQLSRL